MLIADAGNRALIVLGVVGVVVGVPVLWFLFVVLGEILKGFVERLPGGSGTVFGLSVILGVVAFIVGSTPLGIVAILVFAVGLWAAI